MLMLKMKLNQLNPEPWGGKRKIKKVELYY